MPPDDKKIIDNPSFKELLEVSVGMETFSKIVSLLEAFGIKNEKLSEVFSQLPSYQEQLKILPFFDKFNAYFSKVGWVTHESQNLDLMKKAIELAEAKKFEDAEHLLADYYNEENLHWLLNTMWGVKEFRDRHELARLAKEDYFSERYHACVPVLLMLIDGLVNDIEQTGFFAEGTDLTAWDSIAGHSSGLQELSKLFRAPTGKTSTERITIPYRNGILHGRDLGYANKIVAAKCWAALFAVRDWAIAIRDGKKNPLPKKPEPNIIEILQSWLETKKLGERIENWRERGLSVGSDIPSTGRPEDYEDCTPERAFAEFMLHWTNNNYGKMAVLITDYLDNPVNRRAGRMRQEFGRVQPITFQMVSINDTAPSMTTITAIIKYEEKDEEKISEITAHLTYEDEKHNLILRDEPNGRWSIHQRSFNPIIYPNVASQAEEDSGSTFLLSIAGLGTSVEDDLSERDEEVLASEIDPIHGWSLKSDNQA